MSFKVPPRGANTGDILNFRPSDGSSSGQVGTTTDHANPQDKASIAIRQLLGDEKGLSITRQLGVANLDMREGYPHSTTGLPYALHGTATVINQKIGSFLASFQDPIRAILATGIHKSKKIIIKRKYVVGGQALITPERAPARTVSIKEDIREVILTRYGGDLEMNLNLFLTPDMAAEELEMKLDAQKLMLEQTLVNLGYETLMEQGTQLVAALQRATPATAGMDDIARQAAAEKIYVHQVFGSFAKHNFPVQNLLAAAKRANMYTPVAGRESYSVMIVPAGMMDMERYTKADSMVYQVSGIRTTDNKPVNMKLENVVQDPRTGVRILVHAPYPSTRHSGTAYPDVNGCNLTSEVGFGTYYRISLNDEGEGRVRITDFDKRDYCIFNISTLKELATGYSEYKEDNHDIVIIRPNMKCLMSSAILAIPGKDTGELLYGYPMTGISTSQTTETMKLQLRVYLGAALYSPDRVMILPHVHFEGLKENYNCTMPTSVADNKAYTGTESLFVGYIEKNTCGPINLLRTTDAGMKAVTKNIPYYSKRIAGLQTDAGGNWSGGDGKPVPMTLYPGHVQQQLAKQNDWVTTCENSGHLGQLDRPDCDRLSGMYRYSKDPNPIN